MESGNLVTEFAIGDLVLANPDVSIFEIPRKEFDMRQDNPVDIDGVWLFDPWHLNDVEPLSSEMAGAFPMFEAGDVILSSRTLNSVFVVDPESHAVKWHRTGETRRQHDPDFRPDGTISVYDNRMGLGESAIVSLDPASFEREVLFDAAEHDFYSNVRGKHAWTDGGHLMVTSSQQGRVFEIDPEGRRTLEFYSLKPDSTEFNYAVTEASWHAPETFTKEMFQCN